MLKFKQFEGISKMLEKYSMDEIKANADLLAEFELDPSLMTDIERLNEMGVAQAYIFQDEMHEYINGGAHGRGIWIRADILRKLASDFPADLDNEGVNIGLKAQRGILKFHEAIMKCGKNTGVIAIVPTVLFAHRGRLHQELFVYRRTQNGIPGGLVNVNE